MKRQLYKCHLDLGKKLVSANPTDPIFLPPTLKFFSDIFEDKKVNKLRKNQSIVYFNVQFNVICQFK